MKPTPPNDASIEAESNRTSRSVDSLQRYYNLAVYSVICRIVNDPGITRGLVQETFSRASNSMPENASPGSWLLTAAKQCALDYVESARPKIQTQIQAQIQAEMTSGLAPLAKALGEETLSWGHPLGTPEDGVSAGLIRLGQALEKPTKVETGVERDVEQPSVLSEEQRR